MRSHRFDHAIRLLAVSAPSIAACSGNYHSDEPYDSLEEPVVYGVDDRTDYASASALHRGWADSVGLVTASSGVTCFGTVCGVQLDMISAVDDKGTAGTSDDERYYGLCPGERFGPTEDQPGGQLRAAEGFCTAFLVGPDLMATAGHCVVPEGGSLTQAQTACGKMSVVFDFHADAVGQTPAIAPSDDVYRCRTALGVSHTETADYLVFRLDRAVTGRSPLPIRRTGRVNQGRPLALMGHPAALPLKVSAGGQVRSNTQAASFEATVDAFAGNSGGPVFDRDNGLVQGILSAGQNDWVFDDTNSCFRAATCLETGCGGHSERVERTTSIAGLVPSIAPRTFDTVADATNGVYSPIAGDFDGDGNMDVFWYGVGSAADRMRWSSGTRTPTVVSMSVSGTYTPVAGDFDGDRRADVLWYAAGASQHPIWWGSSSRTFTKTTIALSGRYQPFAGDFDGDGRSDVFWYAPGSAADMIWFGAGGRTFATVDRSVSGTYSPVVGDFDGTGTSDILWYAAGTAADYYWWGSASRTFSSVRTTITPTYRPFAGDFDGDGGTDIVLYAPGSGADSLLWSRRDRTFAPQTLVVNGTYTPIAGDFNGDASSDIYWYGVGTAIDKAAWARLR